MKISLHEPLWFGKKGEIPFDYERSDWHQRYLQLAGSGSGTTLGGSGRGMREKVDTSGHQNSGIGGGSGGTQGRNNTPEVNAAIGKAVSSPEDVTPSSSGTNSGLSEKRLVEQHRTHLEEQRRRSREHREARNSTGTGTTAVSRHSDRPPLPEEPLDSFVSGQSAHSAHSAHSDPNWSASDMAPPPLRVPSTQSNRTGRSFSQSSNTMSYPGRIIGYPRTRSEDGHHIHSPSNGITRTESGHTTYFPDGINDTPVTYLPENVEQEIRGVLGRSGVALDEGDRVVLSGDGRAVVTSGPGTRTSSFSHYVARDAGRGH